VLCLPVVLSDELVEACFDGFVLVEVLSDTLTDVSFEAG
jgi:hypothetical protein